MTRDAAPRGARRRFAAFLLLAGAVIAAVAALAGLLVGRFFEIQTLRYEEKQTAAVVQNQARQHLSPSLFDADGAAAASGLAAFQDFTEGLPGVFRVKVFAPTGRIIWSNEPRLIGQIFPDNRYVQRALGGAVTTVLEKPTRAEHVYERVPQYVAEAYVPITFPGDLRVRGVIETYKDMTGAMAELRRLQSLVWLAAGGLGALLYAALGTLAWRAYATEVRALVRLERQNHDLRLLQRFTRSVLSPLVAGDIASRIVQTAAEGLGLRTAALYRADEGAALHTLACWPSGGDDGELASFGRAALESGRIVLREGAVAVPLVTSDGRRYVFVALHLGVNPLEPIALATIEIMLQETAIALANVQLFTETRDAHERLAAIMAAISDEIVILGPDMEIVWLNKAAEARVGSGAVGRRCFEVLGAESDACQNCPAYRTFASGTVDRGVRAQPGGDGRVRYFDLITAPLRDATGRVHRVVEVARDVTDLVEMEERLKQTNQALVDAQHLLVAKERLAAVGQVVVGLHHAILNPLSGMLGALAVLRQATDEPERAQALAAAESEARNIERLVRRLRDLRTTETISYVGDTTMLDLDRLADPDT